MTDKTKAISVIIIGSVVGGAVSSVTKIGLVKIPPFSFSFLRFFIASVVLLPFFVQTKVKLNRDFCSLILLSFLPTINVALFVLGVKTTTASIGQLLYSGTPILAAVFSYFILRQKLNLKKWLFIIFGFLGVTLVILLPLIDKSSLYAGDFQGNLLISVGVFFWSLYVVLSKQYQKKYSPLVITSMFIFLATVVFFFLSLVEFQTNNLWLNQLSPGPILAVLYVSLFATIGSYLLNQYAIKFGGPILASLGFYLIPIFAFLSAFILLGERLTFNLIIGTAIVFLSLALTTYTK